MSTTGNGKNVRTVFMRRHHTCKKSIVKRTKTKREVCGRIQESMRNHGMEGYNVGNLSAMETGDLVVVEEQDAVKMDKDEEKARQLRLTNLETSVISGSVTSVLKPSKKSKVMSSNGKENALLIPNDEVRYGFLLYFTKNNIFLL